MFRFLIIGIIVILYIFIFNDTSFGIHYIENFFSEEDFLMIKRECNKLVGKLRDEQNPLAENRLSVDVPDSSKISKLCMDEKTKIKLKIPQDTQPSDIPIEYRKYPIGGSMDWHKDVVLYTKPQYEMVYTVDNTSDSKTLWYDPKHQKVNEIITKPNSMIVIKADDIQHCVTPVTRGERSIVKFAYMQT